MTEDQKIPKPLVVRSGGQTGVDRAALDWAIAHLIPHGGWCPRGRTANDGPLPAHYCLQETESAGYSQRTRMNVRDAHATLILHQGPLEGGSRLTLRFAQELGKPVHLVDLQADWTHLIHNTRSWWLAACATELNVAGPSEQRTPGIAEQAIRYMNAVWDLPGPTDLQMHTELIK